MQISVQKLSQDDLKKKGVFQWPVWSKEVSNFPWTYDSIEECYLLEGQVSVQTPEGNKVTFGKGDFVTFPKGISCNWDIKQAVRKHYNFR